MRELARYWGFTVYVYFYCYTNMFAADLLIDDEDIHALSKEDMDYFSMCKYLCTTPDVMSFKLFSLIRRGHSYNLTVGMDSMFLGK